MIASVETDVFALDLAPAAKLGRDSLFLSPDRMTARQKNCPLKNLGDNWGTKMKILKL